MKRQDGVYTETRGTITLKARSLGGLAKLLKFMGWAQ